MFWSNWRPGKKMEWKTEITAKSRTPHRMHRYSVLGKTGGYISMLRCLIWSHLAQFCSDSKKYNLLI